MTSQDPIREEGYSWEFLRGWALDFVIEYMAKGHSAALCMCAAIDQQRLSAGDWDARDAVQFLTEVITEQPGSVLDAEHERRYFAECGRAFVQEMEPKSVVRECSRILGRMEESTEPEDPCDSEWARGRDLRNA